MEQMEPTEPTPAPLAAAPAKRAEIVREEEESPAHVCIHCLKDVDGTETVCSFGWCIFSTKYSNLVFIFQEVGLNPLWFYERQKFQYHALLFCHKRMHWAENYGQEPPVNLFRGNLGG